MSLEMKSIQLTGPAAAAADATTKAAASTAECKMSSDEAATKEYVPAPEATCLD